MYMVNKNGMWLMGYRPTGIREFVDGKLQDVSTAVWSNSQHDGRLFKGKTGAQARAREFGGQVIDVHVRGVAPDDE